jgi:hypothetical protein
LYVKRARARFNYKEEINMPRKGNAEKSNISNEEKCEHRALCDDDDDDDDEDQFEDSFASHPEEEEGGNPQEQFVPIEDGHDSSSTSIVTPIFPSFVHSGLHRKAPFTELKYWTALSLTLDGRDKITKVLQYTSRFLGWWFLSKARTSGHGRRFTSLYKSLGKSRKAFRLGRSINEIQKISSAGLLGLLCWHLKQQYLEDSCKTKIDEEIHEECSSEKRNQLQEPSSSGVSLPSFSPSTRTTIASNRNDISHRILSMLYSSLGAVFPSNDESKVKWWKVIGSSLKTIGMIGYWLGDNANFLTSSGALDNYGLSEKDRLARRKRWAEVTGKKADQFYFFVTMIGLVTNSYAYYRFQLKNALLPDRQEQLKNNSSGSLDIVPVTERKKEENQFSLFLALLKSCMDVIVFSNNPGIDLHKKWRGHKNHEAIHCLCGLVSASASLYNNFPDAKI